MCRKVGKRGKQEDKEKKKTHVGSVARIGSLEGAGDLHGGRVGVATARDADLGACDVELRHVARVVDRQRLDAQQVLAVLDALGDAGRVVTWVGLLTRAVW